MLWDKDVILSEKKEKYDKYLAIAKLKKYKNKYNKKF